MSAASWERGDWTLEKSGGSSLRLVVSVRLTDNDGRGAAALSPDVGFWAVDAPYAFLRAAISLGYLKTSTRGSTGLSNDAPKLVEVSDNIATCPPSAWHGPLSMFIARSTDNVFSSSHMASGTDLMNCVR